MPEVRRFQRVRQTSRFARCKKKSVIDPIGITTVVLEVSVHGVPGRIAQFYGELRYGQLRRTERRGNDCISIDNWYGHALPEALQLLIDTPGCYSVVRFHSSHFEPWHYSGPSIGDAGRSVAHH